MISSHRNFDFICRPWHVYHVLQKFVPFNVSFPPRYLKWWYSDDPQTVPFSKLKVLHPFFSLLVVPDWHPFGWVLVWNLGTFPPHASFSFFRGCVQHRMLGTHGPWGKSQVEAPTFTLCLVDFGRKPTAPSWAPGSGYPWKSRWWFRIFFIFTPIWGRFPIWLIFFKWVGSTTN